MKSLSTAGAAQEAKSKIFCRDLHDEKKNRMTEVKIGKQ